MSELRCKVQPLFKEWWEQVMFDIGHEPEEVIHESTVFHIVKGLTKEDQRVIVRSKAKTWSKLFVDQKPLLLQFADVFNAKILFLLTNTTTIYTAENLGTYLSAMPKRSFYEELIYHRIKLRQTTEIELILSEMHKSVEMGMITKQHVVETLSAVCQVMREGEERIEEGVPIYPNLECHGGGENSFPFLSTIPPSELCCSILNPNIMWYYLISHAHGNEVVKINSMSYHDAWKYCDQKYFIPMIDEKRDCYERKKEEISPVAKEVVTEVAKLLKTSGKTDDNLLLAISEMHLAVKETYKQLVSSGLSAPKVTQERPVFDPNKLPLTSKVGSSGGKVRFVFDD